MPFNIPPQGHYFYSSDWTAEMDAAFLTSIVCRLSTTSYKPHIPAHALLMAVGEVNEAFGCSFSPNDGYERYASLEKRFRTFKEIIDVPATHWDLTMNYISATDEVWTALFKKNPFAKAYYHVGEPEFEKLAILFGSGNIKVEGATPVIVVSDTTQPNDPSTKSVVFVSSEEEVTSPPNQFVPLCHKLFDDGTQTSDLNSSNDRVPNYIVSEDGVDHTFPLRNAFSPRSDFKPKKSLRMDMVTALVHRRAQANGGRIRLSS